MIELEVQLLLAPVASVQLLDHAQLKFQSLLFIDLQPFLHLEMKQLASNYGIDGGPMDLWGMDVTMHGVRAIHRDSKG